MPTIPPLPEGFSLDEPDQKQKNLAPSLPPGFTMDAGGFDPAQFGDNYEAARKAIDALPQEQRQAAIDAYAKDYVTRERSGGGIGQAVFDHVRRFARNVPLIGEFADELNAGTAALLGGDYEMAHAAEQERRRQLDADQEAGRGVLPIANLPMVGQIDTGSLAKGAGLISGAAAAPWAAPAKATQVGAVPAAGINAALNTAIYSAADTAGQRQSKSGEGFLEGAGQRIEEGAYSGSKAAPVGAVTGMVGQKLFGRLGEPKTLPRTSEDIGAEASKAYKAADDAGFYFSKSMPERLKAEFDKVEKDFGFDKDLQGKAMVIKRRVDEMIAEDAPGAIRLKDMENFRKVIGNVIKDGNPSEKALAMRYRAVLDDAMSNPQAGEVARQGFAKAQDKTDGVKALQEARKLWRDKARTTAVEDALEMANLRTQTTGSGGNINNAIRQEFRKLITNKRLKNNWTPAERQQITKIAAGSTMENLARRIGKLSPEGNGLMLGMHMFGGMATGGYSLPLAVVGFASKRFADKATQGKAEAFLERVAGSQTLQSELSRFQKAASNARTDTAKKLVTQQLVNTISAASDLEKQDVKDALEAFAINMAELGGTAAGKINDLIGEGN